MPKPLGLLTRTIALSVIVDVGAAAAQTVIVRSAASGSTIEVQVENEPARSATPDANGDATLSAGLPPGTTEAAVQVYTDTCGNVVHVHLVRRGIPIAPPEAGCTRGEVWGAFVMRPVTTFVVDVDQQGAPVHVRQGLAPPEWLERGEPSQTGRPFATAPPAGFTVFGGAGLGRDSGTVAMACGGVTTCTGGKYAGAVSIGATVWANHVLGAQVSFSRRAQAAASGSGDAYQFKSSIETRLITVAGMAGVSARAVRIYAQGGASRHRATFSTTQTADDISAVVDGVTRTIKGGTQTLAFTTEGWGLMLGGGIEVWARRFIAVYADGQYSTLQGKDVGGGPGQLDDHLLVITAGLRVRIGR